MASDNRWPFLFIDQVDIERQIGHYHCVLVFPAHEQLYPSKLLPHRLEEYCLDNAPPTQNRAYAVKLTGQQVVDGIRAAKAKLGLDNIDDRYYVGTCFHEAGCSNEVDTEVATASSPTGFVSCGAFQIGEEEAKRFGFKLEDMLDFGKSCECFVQLAEANRQQIRVVAGLGNKPDPDYTDNGGIVWTGGTMRAYLAITHNHGVGYMRASILKYGLDWSAYIRRNPTDNIVTHGYGSDCVDGGAYYPGGNPVVPGRRTLQLTKPMMIGPDVKELQLHLKHIDPTIDADGTFGPRTESAVITFQKVHGLNATGVCDSLTWQAILVA